jgi:uncharacterized metal-binding protein
LEVKCSCSDEGGESVLVFACSGGSNVGQMSNEIAKRMTKEGVGSMFCLAGIGGRVSGIVETTRAASRRIVIDGCPLSCAKKTLTEAGLEPDDHIILTELGMKKGPGLDLDGKDVEMVYSKVIEKL